MTAIAIVYVLGLVTGVAIVGVAKKFRKHEVAREKKRMKYYTL